LIEKVRLSEFLELISGPVSELQRHCSDHAESLARHTVFESRVKIEDVQALSKSNIRAALTDCSFGWMGREELEI
jgi:hypothetical protein